MDQSTAPPTVDFYAIFADNKPNIPEGVAVMHPQFDGLYFTFPDGEELNIHDAYAAISGDDDPEFFVGGTAAHTWLTAKLVDLFGKKNIDWVAETDEEVVIPIAEILTPTS